MSSTESLETVSIDNQVDDYVRGLMTAEQEMAFEAEFLEKPELLKQVEQDLQFKRGLADIPQSECVGTQNTEPSILIQWLRGLLIPQTAWGAVAASLILVPVLFFNSAGEALYQPAATQFHLINHEQGISRSSDNASSTLQIDSSVPRLVLGLKTPVNLTAPKYYRVTIISEAGLVVADINQLIPNHQRLVFLEIPTKLLSSGDYSYKVYDTTSGEIAYAGRLSFTSIPE